MPAIRILQVRIKEKQTWVYGSYQCLAKSSRGHISDETTLSEASEFKLYDSQTVITGEQMMLHVRHISSSTRGLHSSKNKKTKLNSKIDL